MAIKLYISLACITLFFGMDILRLEQSALFFGADTVPDTIPITTEEGLIKLRKTDYSYFSFWFANAAYSHAFTAPHPAPLSAILHRDALRSFSLFFPETRTAAVLEYVHADGTKAYCGLITNTAGDAATQGLCAGNEPITSLRIILTKPTSIKEKIQLFVESF